ncbi:DUF169 domain-containing protein [Natranaerofaba carboxydovora]|uniref:DUF169 domain-containing protein n=1 Tax=Natranaerofaba carboxydovora TaxID=2742683 RepID=UPI001F1377F6|nr:DUF169 domain-containing protein [Natranaerofaba carboxydovora]UMZ73464.1 putative ArCR [Natranaerofaba carboxydovora]
MTDLKQVNDALNSYLRPATFPVAVKISQAEDDFPPKTKHPGKHIGHRVALCQGMSIARRIGWRVGFSKDDHACAIAIMIFGHEEEPEMVKNGEVVYPYYTSSKEAGQKTQEITPRAEKDSIKSITMAPLEKADFDPDVIVVYGNAAQITRLVQGSLFHSGGKIDSSFSGRGACGSSILIPYQTKECKVTIPGGGERIFAHTTDEELCFSIPKDKIDDTIDGLIKTHQNGIARVPTPFYGLFSKPDFPDKYKELEEKFNMKD